MPLAPDPYITDHSTRRAFGPAKHVRTLSSDMGLAGLTVRRRGLDVLEGSGGAE